MSATSAQSDHLWQSQLTLKKASAHAFFCTRGGVRAATLAWMWKTSWTATFRRDWRTGTRTKKGGTMNEKHGRRLALRVSAPKTIFLQKDLDRRPTHATGKNTAEPFLTHSPQLQTRALHLFSSLLIHFILRKCSICVCGLPAFEECHSGRFKSLRPLAAPGRARRTSRPPGSRAVRRRPRPARRRGACAAAAHFPRTKSRSPPAPSSATAAAP